MSVSFLAGGAGILAGAIVALFVMRNKKTAPTDALDEAALVH